MGGSAFASTNPTLHLHTPRMPSRIYTQTRDNLLAILRTFFVQAECPIEAPEKSDYGDIDILVSTPLKDAAAGSADEIARAIGAVTHKRTSGNPTTHFAVPWPTTLPDDDDNNNKTGAEAEAEAGAKYIQLDLHLCPTPTAFAWELFHHSHGDLWNIIGSSIRRLGLTPSNSGFYVRIEELESRNKNAARVLLTKSPGETLRFLGLDEKRYWSRFGSVKEMFRYAASCRFFDPRRYGAKRWDKGELKANDRKRARKRDVVSRWLEEYLPNCAGDEPADAVGAAMSRGEVVEEAKSWFGVAEEYEERRRRGLKDMRRERMWTEVRKELDIEPESVGAVMRGAKREVVREDEESGTEMTEVQRAYAEEDFDTVVRWVRDNWRDIEERQLAYDKQNSTKHLLAKLDRLRAEGKADEFTRLGKSKKGDRRRNQENTEREVEDSS